MSVSLANGANGQEILDKKISLSIDRQGIRSILSQIEKKAGVRFAYMSETITFGNERISLEANNEKLGDILRRILKPMDVSFEVTGKQIILRRMESPLTDVAESIDNNFRKISGTVRSAKDGVPVEGASVTVKGFGRGTATMVDGHFIIDAVDGDVLSISAIGYTTAEVTVGAASTYTIQLQVSDKGMNEVVVTALGISKQKRQLGFSVTEVKGAVLSVTNEVNPINALQGRVAGVQIDAGGAGGLFSNSRIVIRGNSTLGRNNQPIFVIDGVIMDNDIFSGTGRDFGNDIKDLNMDNFESVSILKGSAAAALYGTRAINGVVLITTKKGRQRKGIGVTVNETVNIANPYAGPDFQNEYGGGTVGAFFTDNRDPNYPSKAGWTTKIFPTDPVTGKPYIDRQINRELENWGPKMTGQAVTNYDGTPTTYSPQPNNFLQAFQTGVGTNTNVAMDGGTDKSTFRFSYNHNQAHGVVPNNTMNKNAFDLRMTHAFSDVVSLDASVSYTDFYGKNPPRLGGLDAFGSNNFGKLFSWMIPRNYNTAYWMQRSKYTSILGGVPDPTNPNEPNKVPEAKFWFTLFNDNYEQREQMIRGRVALTVKLSSWAKLVLEANLNNIYTRNENSELGESLNFAGGQYEVDFRTKNSAFFKSMVMVTKNITKDLTFSGYIGAERQQYKTYYDSSRTDGGLSYPGNFFLANSVNTPITNAGVLNRKILQSFYTSADLGYKDMLFLQATWRGDYSSGLAYSDGSGSFFYNYPAVSLSWIFSETFKMLPSWISFGKLRGNIAALGGDADPFTLNPGFVFSGYSNANGYNLPISTYSSSTVNQKNLRAPSKVSEELGLEMRFLKNRLGFDLSFYKDNSKNQIIPIGTPVESGVGNILINAGNIQNKGIELSIDATPVKTKDFTWNTAINYAVNQNRIISLYPGRTEFDLGANIGEISTWAIVGKSYGTLRTAIHSTTFQATDANGKPVADVRNGLPVLAWRSDARTAFPVRSNKLRDVGDINPKFRAGWDNTFTYKSFSLNVLLDAKIGGDFVALSYRYGTHTGVFPNTLQGRDASHGGIGWTSKFDGQSYDDGMLPTGVFAQGQMIGQVNGSQVDVSGLTFKEAYDKGYVEPSHTPQFFYRYGSSSTGVSDYWILKNSYIALRQVAISYNVPAKWFEKIKLNGLSLSVVGRNLLYVHQSLPYNFNPESNNSNNTAWSGEQGFLPKTRTIAFSLKAAF
ncbi:MAG: SusC/RagA family TonB-linked outer membrane protein [Chitinophagaceae bacterium]|nr:SusC/RagA family TonB-linked outer membrane protein [Chitinophagaceae bacterium]